ncbi:MAG: hypothetical protein ACTTJC_07050 [Campylobacter sp.]
MNAVTFLGQDKINELRSGGMDDFAIRDYAKSEYGKVAGRVKGGNLSLEEQSDPHVQMYLKNEAMRVKPKANINEVNSLINEKGLDEQILPFASTLKSVGASALASTANSLFDLQSDYKKDIANAKGEEATKSAVNNALSRFDNSAPMLFNSEDKKKNKENFLNQISDLIAKNGEYDGLSMSDGKLYLDKKGALIPLDDGVIKQIGRIMRDNAGSVLGALGVVFN